MSITTVLNPTANIKNTLPVLVMETNANPVTAGGTLAGWVSGDPRSIGNSTTVNVVFDLGPDWSLYSLLQLTYVPGWVANVLTIRIHGSDTTTFPADQSRRLVTSNFGAANGANTAFYTITANTPAGSFLRPMGRYVIAQIQTDATGSTSATAKVAIAAYPQA